MGPPVASIAVATADSYPSALPTGKLAAIVFGAISLLIGLLLASIAFFIFQNKRRQKRSLEQYLLLTPTANVSGNIHPSLLAPLTCLRTCKSDSRGLRTPESAFCFNKKRENSSVLKIRPLPPFSDRKTQLEDFTCTATIR